MSKKKKKKNNGHTKKNNIKQKDYFSMTEVLVITVLAIIFGWFIGSIVTDKTSKMTDSKEMKKLQSVYNHIVSNYYKKVDKKELIEASINGMLDYLDDPYTSYMNEEETDSFNQVMSGEYKGVGVSIIKYKDDIIVTGVFKESPASKAGIKIGDIITEVAGTSMKDKEAEDVIKLVKDKKEVKVKVKRKDEEKEFNLKPQKVVIPSVSSEVLESNNKKVGLISISIFASNTSTQFKKEFQSLEKKDIDLYIIDLRGNYGGYLTSATDILSQFMDNTHVIYQIENNSKTTKYYSEGNITKKYKVVVLIDENSASAAEVVAAALKESYGATVVGKKSYGKGTVQQTADLEGGGSIKYTIENWLTPNGEYINKNGINPNITVELDDDYYDDPTNENDNQLQAALKEITKK